MEKRVFVDEGNDFGVNGDMRMGIVAIVGSLSSSVLHTLFPSVFSLLFLLSTCFLSDNYEVIIELFFSLILHKWLITISYSWSNFI
jgi:hypothetical protein